MGKEPLAVAGAFDDDLVELVLARRSRALLPRMGSSKRLSHSSTA